MKTTINFNRLWLGLQEFYRLYNKGLMVTLSLILIYYLILLLYPKGALYTHLFGKQGGLSIREAQNLITAKEIYLRQLPIFTVLFVFWIINNYIKRFKSNVSRNLLPLSAWDNTLILIIGSVGITVILFFAIYSIDAGITQLYRRFFYEDAMRLLAKEGQLYPYIAPYSNFNQIPFSFFQILFNQTMICYILFTAGMLWLKDNNIFFLVFLAALVGLFYLLNVWFIGRSYNAAVDVLEIGFRPLQLIYQAFLLLLGLYLIRSLFRENEV